MDRVKIALLVYIALANAAGWSYVANSPSSLKQGIQGPGIKPDGKITVSSVMGQYMDQVDPATGKITPFIPFPKGSADDEAYRSDGTLVYTALLEGEVRSRSPNGVIKTIGTNNPVSPNGVAFDLNNVCFYSQYPAGTGFYRVDPSGNTEQVLIASLSSPMNGFDFGLDNKAYGPLPFEGTVVALDTTTGTTTVISSGYLDPESVRWSVDKKKLYVLDTGISSILEINTKTGASTKICTVPGLVYLDNFRVLGDSFIISDTVTNTVFQYNITTKKLRTVTTPNVFSLPMGISHNKGKLYIADFVSQKFYNTNNRKIETQARCGPQPPSTNQYDNQDVSFGIFNVYANSKFSAFSDNFDGRVQIRFTSDNKVFSQVSSGFAYGSYISDDNKYLVFNDFGTGIRVCSGPQLNNCNTLTQFPYTTLTGMAPGRKAGTVYVADYYEGKVFLVNYLTGKYNLVVSGLDKPEGISSRFGILGNDQLFVANTGGKTLVSVLITNNILGLPLPVSSTVTSVIATDLPIGLPGQAVFPEPFTFTGVAVADDGFVYITSDLESALIRVLALPIVI